VRAQEATKALFVSETSVNENSGANHAVCRWGVSKRTRFI
jgi:hypothetical protein